MDTLTNFILIELEIVTKTTGLHPSIEIGIDDKMFFAGQSDEIKDRFVIQTKLASGMHELWIDLTGPEELPDDPACAVIVSGSRFQHLDDDFSIFSRYRPQYPEHWIRENLENNIELPVTMHSNHLGWCGRWSLEFHTPIYNWIHQQLNLGWLL